MVSSGFMVQCLEASQETEASAASCRRLDGQKKSPAASAGPLAHHVPRLILLQQSSPAGKCQHMREYSDCQSRMFRTSQMVKQT